MLTRPFSTRPLDATARAIRGGCIPSLDAFFIHDAARVQVRSVRRPMLILADLDVRGFVLSHSSEYKAEEVISMVIAGDVHGRDLLFAVTNPTGRSSRSSSISTIDPRSGSIRRLIVSSKIKGRLTCIRVRTHYFSDGNDAVCSMVLGTSDGKVYIVRFPDDADLLSAEFTLPDNHYVEVDAFVDSHSQICALDVISLPCKDADEMEESDEQMDADRECEMVIVVAGTVSGLVCIAKAYWSPVGYSKPCLLANDFGDSPDGGVIMSVDVVALTSSLDWPVAVAVAVAQRGTDGMARVEFAKFDPEREEEKCIESIDEVVAVCPTETKAESGGPMVPTWTSCFTKDGTYSITSEAISDASARYQLLMSWKVDTTAGSVIAEMEERKVPLIGDIAHVLASWHKQQCIVLLSTASIAIVDKLLSLPPCEPKDSHLCFFNEGSIAYTDAYREQIVQRRSMMPGGLLFIDRLLNVAIGTQPTVSLYPPTATNHVQLLNAIKTSALTKHQRNSVIYYLLCNEHLDRANQFAKDAFLPDRFRLGISGYWCLDNGHFSEAVAMCSCPDVEVDWPLEVVQVLSKHARYLDLVRFVEAKQPCGNDSSMIAMIMDAMLHVDISTAVHFMRRYPELSQSLHAQLYRHLFDGTPDRLLLHRMLTFPFTTDEEVRLESYCRDSNAPQISRTFLVMYFINRARFMEAIQLNNWIRAMQGEVTDIMALERDSIVDGIYKALPKVQRAQHAIPSTRTIDIVRVTPEITAIPIQEDELMPDLTIQRAMTPPAQEPAPVATSGRKGARKIVDTPISAVALELELELDDKRSIEQDELTMVGSFPESGIKRARPVRQKAIPRARAAGDAVVKDVAVKDAAVKGVAIKDLPGTQPMVMAGAFPEEGRPVRRTTRRTASALSAGPVDGEETRARIPGRKPSARSSTAKKSTAVPKEVSAEELAVEKPRVTRSRLRHAESIISEAESAASEISVTGTKSRRKAIPGVQEKRIGPALRPRRTVLTSM